MTLREFLESGGDLKELKNSDMIALVYDWSRELYIIQRVKEIRYRALNTYYIESIGEKKTILGESIIDEPLSIGRDEDIFLFEQAIDVPVIIAINTVNARVFISKEEVLAEYRTTSKFEFLGLWFHVID